MDASLRGQMSQKRKIVVCPASTIVPILGPILRRLCYASNYHR